MVPKAVTFDCAQTLIAVDWRPALVAVESATLAGLRFDEAEAAACYDRVLRGRWHLFAELNLTGGEEDADVFWHETAQQWCIEMGWPATEVPRILSHADQLVFGQGSSVFAVYEDVVPCLTELARAGVRMAVVSNWDLSLHRTLRTFALDGFFEFALASLQVGCEKPNPAIFETALARFGLPANEVVHVGDNPVDDFRGAKALGMGALIIDRSSEPTQGVYLSSLLELPGRLGL